MKTRPFRPSLVSSFVLPLLCVGLGFLACGGRGTTTDSKNTANQGGGTRGSSAAGGGSALGGGNSSYLTDTSQGGAFGSTTLDPNGLPDGGADSGTDTEPIPLATGFDKIDLLFTLDNSLGMGEKQVILAASIPQMLARLTNPQCVDPSGKSAPQSLPSPTTPCPAGLKREFTPVNDIHMGIVTSSLGDFGGDVCPENGDAPYLATNDHAWLLGALPRTTATLNGQPFLAWAPAGAEDYESRINAKVTEFATFVVAASELGCGNEMLLESWYRFLVDPKPPIDVLMKNSAANYRGSIDNNILSLRRAFLRPDSLVAVVMLSDENDCSMRDDDYSWVAMTAQGRFRMWRGSSVCASNPNDPCCYSCMLDQFASEQCRARDTSCRQGDATARLSDPADAVNLRCRQMKKRFGHDFLFPPSRYVNALTKPLLCPDQTYGDLDCDCREARSKGLPCSPNTDTMAKNPLFVNLDPAYSPTGPVRRDAQGVYLAGIVGVPWQDLAQDPSPGAALALQAAKQLNWDLFAPMVNEDYSTAMLLDPLMIESTQPRSGRHPVTGEALAPPESARLANSINGHEWYTADADVQFACVFNLDQQLNPGSTAVRTCDLAQECGLDEGSDTYRICARRFDGCPCVESGAPPDQLNPNDPSVSRSPLCQNPDNLYGNRQYFARAQPGLRELQVLRGFFEATASNNAVVGSICPKSIDLAERGSSDYGYNAAFTSLVDRFKERLRSD